MARLTTCCQAALVGQGTEIELVSIAILVVNAIVLELYNIYMLERKKKSVQFNH